MHRKHRTCPKCGSTKVAKILYGMPGYSEELKQKEKNGEIFIGGCIISDDDPQWHCNSCQYKWGKEKR